VREYEGKVGGRDRKKVGRGWGWGGRWKEVGGKGKAGGRVGVREG